MVFFTPLWQQQRDLSFFEIRGKLFEHSVSEVNAAAGYRSMLDSGWNLGGWLGLDTRETRAENRFWQIATGFEALHPDWDFRANAYSSLTDPQSSSELAEVRVSGNQIEMVGGEDVGLSGFDAEVGAKVPLQRFLGEQNQEHELRLYVGGYSFDDSDALQEVEGPKVRAVWKINGILKAMPSSHLALRTRYSDDDVRNSNWQMGVQLVVPLSQTKGSSGQRPRLNAQQRRMTESLERDTDIVTVRSDEEPVVDVATGAPLDSITLAS